MKKTTKVISLIMSALITTQNIFTANAGNTVSSGEKSDVPGSSTPSRAYARFDPFIRTQTACFIYPPLGLSFLKDPTEGKINRRTYYKDLESLSIFEKLKGLVKAGFKLLTKEKATGKTCTRKVTFLQDKHSTDDTACLTAFVDKFLGYARTPATPEVKFEDTSEDATKGIPMGMADDIPVEINCRYSDFMLSAYSIFHSDKLLSASNKLKALQWVFEKLKAKGKYMLSEDETNRFLALDATKATKFVFAIIPKEVESTMLKQGDIAILIEFPEVSILHVIR